MTEKDYNLAEGIRRSALWQLTKSPAHFRYYLEHPQEPTPAMTFGTAVHTAILTPDMMPKMFELVNLDMRTKEGKAAKQAALDAGKTVLTGDMAETLDGILRAVWGNPIAKRLLDGPHETPYFWVDEMTGEKCKCRTDAETDVDGQHIVVDLKTCNDASTDAFMRDAIRLGYHVQAAMYADGVKAVTGKDSIFIFLAVEKEAPYAINILQCDEAFMLRGMDEYRYLLGLYHECKENDNWPSYEGMTGSINTLGLPAWMKKEVE